MLTPAAAKPRPKAHPKIFSLRLYELATPAVPAVLQQLVVLLLYVLLHALANPMETSFWMHLLSETLPRLFVGIVLPKRCCLSIALLEILRGISQEF